MAEKPPPPYNPNPPMAGFAPPLQPMAPQPQVNQPLPGQPQVVQVVHTQPVQFGRNPQPTVCPHCSQSVCQILSLYRMTHTSLDLIII